MLLEDPADALVHAFKYEGWRALAPLLARTMRRIRLPPVEGSPVVVFVPTTRRRERSRGYNQAELLARALASELGLEVVAAARRTGAAGTQVALRPEERRANVRGAFELTSDAVELKARPVLLVDDVLTTGATACELAGVLERARPRGVTLVTFARSLPDLRRTQT